MKREHDAKSARRPAPDIVEERRAHLEAQLRAATREYEDELLAMFDRLPKWHSAEAEGEPLRHHYWNGQEWVQYDLNNPPLWAVENIDVDNLPAPAPWGDPQLRLPSH